MIKFVVVLAVLVGLAQAAPQDATITKQSSDNLGVDGYAFAYETSDGVSRQESGKPNPEGGLEVTGSNGYSSPEGRKVEVTFVADENGYRPVVNFS